MYGAKCMLVGMLAGIAIGASNTLVQRHVNAVCKCSKDLMDDANKKIQSIQAKKDTFDMESVKTFFTDKLEQVKNMLDSITNTLSKEEIQEKISEVSEKVENLFQEIKQSFSM